MSLTGAGSRLATLTGAGPRLTTLTGAGPANSPNSLFCPRGRPTNSRLTTLTGAGLPKLVKLVMWELRPTKIVMAVNDYLGHFAC